MPDSENEEKKVDIMLYPVNKDQIKVKIVNGNPYISIKADFIGRIYSMKENSKYLENHVLKDLSNQVNLYLKNIFYDYLYKTSISFKSDINEFGKYAAQNFLTTKDFENYNWQKNYPNSTFNIEINTNVESGFLVTET